MNRITKHIIVIFLLAFTIFSCEKDLDLKPLDKISELSYFSEPQHYKLFANQFYEYFPTFNALSDRDNISDIIAHWSQNSSSDGSYIATPTSDHWEDSYVHIRRTNDLINRADNAADELKADIAVYVAEAKFFRAYLYYNLYKEFGGVPIYEKPIGLEDEDQLLAPRNTREEVATFILKDLDAAIAGLPAHDQLTGVDVGRVSKEAAQALKARVALFEGTWQKYRGNNADALLQQAIDASQAVVNSSSFELFDRRDVLGDESYKHLFLLDKATSNAAGLTKGDNKEYILAKKYDVDIRPAGSVRIHVLPSPTRKFADLFLCTDGLPIDKSPLFQGRSTILSEYENRDMRMTNVMAKPFTRLWSNNPAEFARNWDNPDAGGFEFVVAFSNETCTGYLRKKGVVEIAAPFSPDVPVIRLAEVYLIYAEALYEKNGSVSDADWDKSINKLRARAGLPALTNAFITSNGLDVREEIRRERTIELFMEGHRLDDLRRWKTAEVEMPMALTGVQYTGTQYANEEPWSEIQFTLDDEGNIVKQAAADRQYTEKHYLFPLPTRQLILNPQLVQNPGWE